MKKADIIKILNNYRTVTDVIQWVEFDSIATDIISAQSKECHCGGYPDCICEVSRKPIEQPAEKATYTLNCNKCGVPCDFNEAFPKDQFCRKCFIELYGNYLANPDFIAKHNPQPAEKEETIIIPKWKMTAIEDVLRQANNIHHSQKKETCFDRCICKAWKFACDALNKEYSFEPIESQSSPAMYPKPQEITDKVSDFQIENIRNNAISACELLNGFTPEQRKYVGNWITTIELLSGHVLYLTSQMTANRREDTCDCKIPYFPTADIHFCSKCNKPTVY